MSIATASGARFYIGTTQAASTLSDYQADSYIEVGEVEDLGEFGDESAEVQFISLADERVQKLKGARDAGTLPVICGADDSDEGQDAMIAAEAEKLDYNFKVVLNDAQTLSGNGSEHYFRGKVMGKRLNVGTANNVVRRNFSVGINTAIISQDAT